jgi:polyisoprenoid-binding protein YceI
VGLAASLVAVTAAAPQARAPLGLNTGRVTIDGTSNIHEWTASTTTVRVTRAQIAASVAGPAFWDEIVKPGGLEAFEIVIPATTLHSPKDGLDKNMYKALKTDQHADITFRLVRVEPRAGAGALRAIGVLKIAGVEREVPLDLTTARKDATLTVRGEVQLLMTDFGIAPPKAMLGMLKTDPKVKVTFETVLAVPLT